jgi:hypothetical protein
MRPETIIDEGPTSSCNPRCFGISSAAPTDDAMTCASSLLKPLVAGLLLTAAQMAVAVCLLAPEGPLSYRYSSLIQHDSYWFQNIVERGYQTTVPPVNHKAMEISNVAFFPAFPAIVALLHYGLHFSTGNALLVTAQTAAWGFWTYFFLFCKRWSLSPVLQSFGALAVVAHPAAFFLVAGYSESLFLMALTGFIFWSSAEGRAAKIWAALHGIAMSATRIVGIPCAAFPLVRSISANGRRGLAEPRLWIRRYAPAIGLMIVATLGAVVFFIYCQLRWGHWNIYMLTQSAGWGVDPNYLAVFKPSSYRWRLPALNNPTEASQISVTFGALLLIGVAICEVVLAVRRTRQSPLRGVSPHTGWATRAGFYFCAAAVFYISVSGVASVEMESMLRYQFCAHALIVLAFLHFLRQFRPPALLVRTFAMAALALGSAAGLSAQGWYVWNFTRGNWVA